MAMNIGTITGPGGVQFSTIPAVKGERPLTQADLDSGEWVVGGSLSQPHCEQIEGVKKMFFNSKVASSAKMGGDVQAMEAEMDRLADSFFHGNISGDELAAGFERLADRFISTCREKQYPFQALTGFDEAELSYVYDRFRASILKSAVAHNNAEGKGYASPINHGWHYYNADYYYKSESAIEAVSGKVKDMAAEKGFDKFEIPDYKALGKNSCYNFNSAVSGESDYIPGGLRAIEETWITDFDEAPPEGFKWFYEAGGAQKPVSALIEGDIEIKGMEAKVWAMLGDVRLSGTFNYSLGRNSPSDVKNLADLLQFRPAGKKEFAAVNKFMKNFQVAPNGYFAGAALRETKQRSQNGWAAKA